MWAEGNDYPAGLELIEAGYKAVICPGFIKEVNKIFLIMIKEYPKDFFRAF